jgi:hypothetical protein
MTTKISFSGPSRVCRPGESAWGRIDWRCSRVPAGCCFGVSVIALTVDCLGEGRASPLDPKCSRRYICGVKGRGPLSSPMASGALRAQPCSLSPFSPTKTPPPYLNERGLGNGTQTQGSRKVWEKGAPLQAPRIASITSASSTSR